MKRILAIALSVMMMLSICTVFASALSGNWGTSQEDFVPVGELEANWDPDAATKITLDGDLSEWVANGYNKYEISPRNMAVWVADKMDPDWKMECFFVADAERLYVAFYITDSSVSMGTRPEAYNDGSGDAFQMAFDWGHNVGDALVDDEYAVSNPQDIFYSFNMIEGERLKFMRQNSDRDGLVYDGNTEEAGEEYDEEWPEFAKDNEWVGMDGAYGITETGWCAEFSVTWQRLASDAYYKLWDAEFFRTAKIGPDQDLEIGCALYYQNSDSKEDGSRYMSWAAGTVKGDADDNGAPQITWTAADDGLTIVLKYHEGMEDAFAATSGIEVLGVGEKESERETENESNDTEDPDEPIATDPTATDPTATDPTATEPTATEPTATETSTGDASATESTTGDATDADTEEEGCSSVIGAGAAALVLSAMAAAVALKKKH